MSIISSAWVACCWECSFWIRKATCCCERNRARTRHKIWRPNYEEQQVSEVKNPE